MGLQREIRARTETSKRSCKQSHKSVTTGKGKARKSTKVDQDKEESKRSRASHKLTNSLKRTSSKMDDKTRATRSEVMAALAPLLITSLEQPSGEVILMLAKLRRMCGTARYQRRFVQRVAPALIRPPRGAMWCLRHQNDMEAILAAAELIFDSAFEDDRISKKILRKLHDAMLVPCTEAKDPTEG